MRKARLTYDGREFHYDGKQTILEFFEEQGIEIPFSCRVGVCGTCKCSSSGKVEALADAGLTLSDKRKGLFLACVALPLEDSVIQLEP